MIRTSIFATAVVSALLTAACNKASDDQQKVNMAQAEANGKIAAAATEATQKAVTAQAEADKKVAEAEAHFTRLRADYRHSTTVSLADLDRKVGDLEAKAKTATGKARTDLDANLKQIHAGREIFVADYRTLETSGAATWDAAQVRLDKEWTDLKALVDRA